MSLRYALSPSGGIIYHLIAYRRSRSTWKPFRAAVRSWLSAWLAPRPDELIIFGPSAGWTLPIEQLAKLRRLTLVEPDPTARFLLRRRLTKAGASMDALEFIDDPNILPWFSKDPRTFKTFLSERPRAAILFSNVLGQVALHASLHTSLHTSPNDHESSNIREIFFGALKGRRWASYHDLFSGTPDRERSKGLTADRLTDSPERLAQDVFGSGNVTDHETAWLSENRVTRLATWPITETTTHLIGFVSEPDS